MTSSEVDSYSRIVRRITRAILVIGALGVTVSIAVKGWRFGLGFGLGACLSSLSFWRWRKVVDALGGTPKGRSVHFLMVRFLALAAVAYVIIKYLEVNPVAVLLGLLVSAAAVDGLNRFRTYIFRNINAGT